MIRVVKLEIFEFRGIRSLTLEMNRENFAICGANGTGKSGVVDGLEFVLTGSVSRLTGEGCGLTAIADHGPHVDSRESPEKARVKVTLNGPTGTWTIERSVNARKAPIVQPNSPRNREILERFEREGACALTRRDLIKYVLAAPQKRSAAIQELLNLREVESVRISLQRIAKSLANNRNVADSTLVAAQQALMNQLKIPDLKVTTILGAVNAFRRMLGLTELTKIDASTDLAQDAYAPPSPTVIQVAKVPAMAELAAATAAVVQLTSQEHVLSTNQLSEKFTKLAAEPQQAQVNDAEQFFSYALNAVVGENCPLCDQPWERAALLSRIEAKIERLKGFVEMRDQARAEAVPTIALIRASADALGRLQVHARAAVPVIEFTNTATFVTQQRQRAEAIASVVPIEIAQAALGNALVIPDEVLGEIEQLRQYVAALPEPSQTDAARSALSLAQDRLVVWRNAVSAERSERERFDLADFASRTFNAAQSKVLSQLYESIEADFARLYAIINPDEAAFRASIKQEGSGLGLEVDFFNRGKFPPFAYHSEGHQDGMGLCLYLALMRHLRGDDFTFAVLDDVVMSVDAEHRRQVCTMLKTEFTDTQFVITTHDEVWHKHLETAGVIKPKGGVHFRVWRLDSGPVVWDDRDAWADVDHYLGLNDVPTASHNMRRHLEYLMTELCQNLRAPVPLKAGHQYTLGDLFNPAVSQLKKHYKAAEESALSWGNTAHVEVIKRRHADLSALLAEKDSTSWPVNAVVHFNEWATFQPADFAPTVVAFRRVVDATMCATCHSQLRVVGMPKPLVLMCLCGATNMNLVKASGDQQKEIAKKAQDPK